MLKNRTIFIGDIHGCYNEFKFLLKRLKIQPKDKVYIVGDMINKGPDSYKVIKFLYKHQDQYKCILGNHELNFFKYLETGKTVYVNQKNSFKELEKKFKKKPHLLEFLQSLPLYIEKDDFVMVHGGLIPGKKIKDHTPEEITKTRIIEGKPWYESYTGKKKVIYGHFALDGVQIRDKTKGLDSGCTYGKYLTAYILETDTIISQNAFNIYVNVYEKKNKKENKGFINNMFKILGR